MGEAASKTKYVAPLELYNRLQDTRDLILVVDGEAAIFSGADAEMAWLQPGQMKALLEDLSGRRARGWTLVVMDAASQKDLESWMRARTLCGAGRLVKEVLQLAGGAEGFYGSFPWLHPQHRFYELGRLYPSLIATVKKTRLFLSNFGVASDPHTYHALGIKYVVNCTRDLPFVDEMMATLRQRGPKDDSFKPIDVDMDDVVLTARLRVPVDDSEDQQICEYFTESVNFISGAVQQNAGHVLIHCKHGQSRSATIAAAYLMDISKERGAKTTQEVVRDLQRSRPRVSPNAGFLKQLQTHGADGCEPVS